MTDFEKRIWELYEREMQSRDNADYVVNKPQMQKLIDAYGFFEKLAIECGGEIEPFRIVAKEVNGGVTAYFRVFHIYGENIQRFSDIIRNVSALSIDSLTDGTVCLSMTVPRVFQHK